MTVSASSPEQLSNALHQAALAIESAETLEETLQQIVGSARQLVGARYAAIGIASAANLLKRFIFSGLTDEEAASMPHAPLGRGLLGAVIEEKRPIRIPCITDDPRSVGFPENHPMMRSFLGVPIISGDVVLGNLYLTNKQNDQLFSAQDQESVEMFAAHAAIAIRKAMLLQETRFHADQLAVQNRKLAALNDVAIAIAGRLDLDGVLQVVADAARDLAESRYAAVVAARENTVDAFAESADDGFSDLGLPSWMIALGQAAREQRPLTTVALPHGLCSESVSSALHCVPAVVGSETIGYFYLAGKDDELEFAAFDLELMEMLAAHTAVVIQNSRLYAEMERLAIAEERARIGMDLHDGVIQSIYAVGLILESSRIALPAEADESDQLMAHAIEGLNDTIRDIRNFILDLRPHRFDGNLDQAIARLVREFQANTMVAVNTAVSPGLAALLTASAATAVFLTTQEALANIARHARATEVHISGQRHNDRVELKIVDNGSGFNMAEQTDAVGHGLSNMRSRAESLNGELSIQSAVGEGTTIYLSLACVDKEAQG